MQTQSNIQPPIVSPPVPPSSLPDAPSPPPPKAFPLKPWVILGVAVFVFFFLAGGFWYVNSNLNPDKPNPTPTSSHTYPTPAATPTISASGSATLPVDLTIPKDNVLYYGSTNTGPGVFLKTPGSDYMGQFQTKLTNTNSFDYRTLQNPQAIYASTQPVDSLTSFMTDTSGNVLYVGANYDTKTQTQYPNLDSSVIRVTLTPFTSKMVWTNRIGSTTYDSAQGAGYVSETGDTDFVVINIANCYACEGSIAGSVILNTSTSKEQYYPLIGNIQFQIPQGTFSYQNLEPSQVGCSPGPGCVDGVQNVMIPSGTTLTETLP